MLTSFLILALAAQTAPVPAKVDKAPDAKKVCRTMPDVSTRISGKRICRTQEEWDFLARQTVDDMRYRGQSSR